MNLPATIRRSAGAARTAAEQNAAWLQQHMSPYFFQAMSDDLDALTLLVREMSHLRDNRHLILADREKRLVIACVNRPGSLYATLRRVGEREISYAMFSHSTAPMPGMADELEVQRFEFDRRRNQEIDLNQEVKIPAALVK